MQRFFIICLSTMFCRGFRNVDFKNTPKKSTIWCKNSLVVFFFRFWHCKYARIHNQIKSNVTSKYTPNSIVETKPIIMPNWAAQDAAWLLLRINQWIQVQKHYLKIEMYTRLEASSRFTYVLCKLCYLFPLIMLNPSKNFASSKIYLKYMFALSSHYHIQFHG